jgi:23S rRNA (cytidine1920-2'-O)/16S rRNA (cytidine1409-2'-O)-methyltransferase
MPPAPRPKKLRLDAALVLRGLAETRSAAQRLIMAGQVFCGEHRLDKAGQLVDAADALELRGQPHPWVSRGGVKLAHAIDTFAIPVAGRVGLDVGASTGGFTDVLLQRGAVRVHAVDVGHGQLAWRLRNDPRVVVHEKTNIRHLAPDAFGEQFDLIVCDVSFIGLETALPAALAMARSGAHLVTLIKPQFEVGKGRVGKGGVVRDPALHAEVCDRLQAWLAQQPGWTVLGVVPSPIEGADGNREFLMAGRIA